MNAGRTVVIGGAGAVGALLRRELAGTLGDVTVVDPAADESGLRADASVPAPELRELVGGASSVILSVPEDAALATLAALAPDLRDDALLVAALSVQSPFAEAVDRQALSCEVLGINPMFRPDLGLRGNHVACVTLRGGPRTDAWLEAMRAAGAVLSTSSAGDHDRMTAASQAAAHAALLAFAGALERMGRTAPELLEHGPPPARALLALLGRLADGSAEVYRDVQGANPFAADARAALQDALADLEARTRTEAGFDDLWESLHALLGDAAGELARAGERMCADAPARRPPG
jgi:prephenate dehydrogenase